MSSAFVALFVIGLKLGRWVDWKYFLAAGQCWLFVFVFLTFLFQHSPQLGREELWLHCSLVHCHQYDLKVIETEDGVVSCEPCFRIDHPCGCS